MFVCHVHAWCPQKSEEGVRSLSLELQKIVSCHVGAENNPGPLQEQQVFFSEPSLQPCI
ncbi:hypothetical protein I79_002911 [Cricetulus griseus]|uniref:Uncharacterized protein n=1 Tax=Cricetulus griseus TaxID=10029 RepID=G3GYT3_CRIGR|nr:hypothetical protein I79_002911 [Cricetulus griseus]